MAENECIPVLFLSSTPGFRISGSLGLKCDEGWGRVRAMVQDSEGFGGLGFRAPRKLQTSCVFSASEHWPLKSGKLYDLRLLQKWRFPKFRGTSLLVPIMRTEIFRGLYWGPPILGNYQVSPARVWGCHVRLPRLA